MKLHFDRVEAVIVVGLGISFVLVGLAGLWTPF
jgi:hypothetical protein